MSKLYIYKASAGSGKTYTLVSQYLKIALKNSKQVEKILSITFTNQATQAMKDRIVQHLYDFSQSIPSSMARELCRYFKWEQEILKEKAFEVLTYILHHYNRFTVTTIDSFFQKVIRSFLQEVGLQTGFTLSFQHDIVLYQIIEQIFEKAKSEKLLKKYLISIIENKIRKGKSWYIIQEIYDLGNELFSENLFKQFPSIHKIGVQKHDLTKIQQIFYKKKIFFEKTLQDLAKQALDIIQKEQLNTQDFAYGKQGIIGYFLALKEKQITPPTKRIKAGIQSSKKWYTQSAKHTQKLEKIVSGELLPILKKVLEIYEKDSKKYYTVKLLNQHIFVTGILAYIIPFLNQHRQEQNTLFISDNSVLLRRIIANHDIPFIYEKIGSFYKYIFVDEFQDLSHFQWENLKPIIHNTLAEGNPNYIVGDVKQAIYRWRGGESQLLGKQVMKDLLPSTLFELNQNWRSQPNIVEFNNFFFKQAVQKLTKSLQLSLTKEAVRLSKNIKTRLEEKIKDFQEIYKAVNQQITFRAKETDRNPGYVQIQFLNKDTHALQDGENTSPRIYRELIYLIEHLQKHQIPLKDITLLVRNHQQAKNILESILAYSQSSYADPDCKYDIVALEALQLANHTHIKLLIKAIEYLIDPTDQLICVELIHIYQNHILQQNLTIDNILATLTQNTDQTKSLLPEILNKERAKLCSLPLPELITQLITLFNLKSTEAKPFLDAFQDQILKYSTQKIAIDVFTFLDKWNQQAHIFKLKLPGKQNAIQILTIHQAKGLEFKNVIIPFCDWLLDQPPQNSKKLWVKTPADVQEVRLLTAIPYSKNLIDTEYAEEYYEEKILTYLDHFNLLYVAFTRAKERLYVYTDTTKKSEKIQNVGQLLQEICSPNTLWVRHRLDAQWSNRENKWSLGKEFLEPKVTSFEKIQNQKEKNDIIIQKLKQQKTCLDLPLSLQFSNQQKQKAMEEGEKQHSYLAKIISLKEPENIQTLLAKEYQQDQKNVECLINEMQKLWKNPLFRNFFYTKWDVITEAEIFINIKFTIRIDRLLLKENHAVIVEFKTGKQNLNTHTQQLQTYVDVLRSMGYNVDKSYIVYLKDNIIYTHTS